MDVTLMVKTMYRPGPLNDLLQSIRQRYPEIPIRVVDDTPTRPEHESAPYPEVSSAYSGVDHEVFGPDRGIGFCLNHILDTCDTEAVVLLEDDFTFSDRTKLEVLWPWIHTGLFDIMGGGVRAHRTGKLQRFMGPLRFKKEGCAPDLELVEPNTVHGVREFDVVMNFFMARTEALRELRWDEDLKVARHIDFYLRAGGWEPHKCPERTGKRLAVGYDQSMEILHHSVSVMPPYAALRHGRLAEYQKYYLEKWGFKDHGVVPAT